MSNNRNVYIDFIRGIVIILVVWGHAIQCIEYGTSYAAWSDNIFKSIYMFHMPLFFAISGYLSFKSIRRDTVINYIKSRIILLLIPMILWCLIYSVIVQSFFTSSFKAFSFIKIFVRSIEYDYWFIWAIMFYSILTPILHKIKMDNPIGFIVSAILLMFATTDHFHFSRIISCFPFFALGYLFARYEKDSIKEFCKECIFIFIILSVVCFYFWNDRTYMYITPSDFVHWKATLFRIVAGSVTSISFLVIFYYIYQYISGNFTTTFLAKVGMETLGIYLSHALIANLIFQKFLSINIQSGYSILYIVPSILFVIIFHYFTLIINKNRIAAYLLLGNKPNNP